MLRNNLQMSQMFFVVMFVSFYFNINCNASPNNQTSQEEIPGEFSRIAAYQGFLDRIKPLKVQKDGGEELYYQTIIPDETKIDNPAKLIISSKKGDCETFPEGVLINSWSDFFPIEGSLISVSSEGPSKFREISFWRGDEGYRIGSIQGICLPDSGLNCELVATKKNQHITLSIIDKTVIKGDKIWEKTLKLFQKPSKYLLFRPFPYNDRQLCN